jgi:hypothetical protein
MAELRKELRDKKYGKILIVRPECNRSRGKPKPNCEDEIENNL